MGQLKGDMLGYRTGFSY